MLRVAPRNAALAFQRPCKARSNGSKNYKLTANVYLPTFVGPNFRQQVELRPVIEPDF